MSNTTDIFEAKTWFLPVECFRRIYFYEDQVGPDNATETIWKCIFRDVIMIMTLVNMVAISYLIIGYIRLKNRKNLLKSTKFYIFMIGWCMSFATTFNFLVLFAGVYEQQVSVFLLAMRYFGIYLSIYFVFKKAGKRLKTERDKFMKYGIKPVLGVSLLVNLSLIIYLEYQFVRKHKNYETIACTSPIWILSAIFDFISVIILMFFVMKFDNITAK